MDPNSDETLWEPWVDGFTRAMRLRPEAWQAVLEQADDETRLALVFLMALQDINEGTSTFADEKIDEIGLDAPGLIPGRNPARLAPGNHAGGRQPPSRLTEMVFASPSTTPC